MPANAGSSSFLFLHSCVALRFFFIVLIRIEKESDGIMRLSLRKFGKSFLTDESQKAKKAYIIRFIIFSPFFSLRKLPLLPLD